MESLMKKIKLWMICMLGFGIAGCSSPMGTRESPLELQNLPADGIYPLVDSQIFAAEQQLIRSARSTICYEMYEIGYEPVVKDLLAAEERGVQIYVITDPTVSHSRKTGEQLRKAGMHVCFLPVPHAIDHVKLLLADNRTALIGGMNNGPGSYKNHDADVWLAGESVSSLPQFFYEDWMRAQGKQGEMQTPDGRLDPPIPHSSAQTTALKDKQIGEHVLAALKNAKQEIRIEMFTLTSQKVLSALLDRHAAGVKVEVIVDGNQKYNQAAVEVLKAHGIPVRAYPTVNSYMHMKLGLIDRRTVLIGSANWTHAALDGINHEIDVELDDRTTADFFADRFSKDFKRSGSL